MILKALKQRTTRTPAMPSKPDDAPYRTYATTYAIV